MTGSLPPTIWIVAALAGSLPAGFAAALTIRRLAQARVSAAATIAACAVLALWALFTVPHGAMLAVTFELGWVLLVLASVDALAFRLPDVLTIPLGVAGLCVALILPEPDLPGHAIAAAIGALAFYAVAVGYRQLRGHDGLGLGDVKLAGAAGAWLGWQALPFVILLASCAGLLWVGVAALRHGRAQLSERIPFGVALCFAIWVIWLYGLPDFLGAE